MIGIYIIILLIISVVIIYFLTRKKNPIKSISSNSQEIPLEEIESDMKKMAEQTVEFARAHFNIMLDYSENSIKEMEKMHEKMYEDVKQLQMPEKEIADIAMIQGAYIGEVIRKYHGGHWEKDHKVLGLNSWPVVFDDDSAVCPIAWCHKRLTNGKEDDVSYKYHVMVKKR